MSSELQVKSLRASHGGYSAESGLLWEVVCPWPSYIMRAWHSHSCILPFRRAAAFACQLPRIQECILSSKHHPNFMNRVFVSCDVAVLLQEHNPATAQSQSDRNPLTKYHTSAVHSVEPEGVVAGISKVFSALNKLGLMAVFSKLSKLVKQNLLTYCYRPKVLEPGESLLV